jgi:hypothetical protein
VDLDNNSISMPSPPPPPLPDKHKAKLIKKLKATANVFEKAGEFSDEFDFGSYLTISFLNYFLLFIILFIWLRANVGYCANR